MVMKPQYGLVALATAWIFAGIGALIIVLLGPTYFEDTFLNHLYLSHIVVKVIFMFIVVVGLLKGIGWAWTGAILISIINFITIAFNIIVLSLVSNSTYIGIIMNTIIIIYLMTPHVRTHFGKTKKSTLD